jgi:hypothetical protein
MCTLCARTSIFEKPRANCRAVELDADGWAKECASLGYAPVPHDIAASELQAVNRWK